MRRPREQSLYRGRLAPSPTGYLHLGHARTFWRAYRRAREAGGVLVLRNEDIDRARCRPEFVGAFLEDLKWLGCEWEEGPDCGGARGPYNQSERLAIYGQALEQLRAAGMVYPCACSRREVLEAVRAPHAGEDEAIYPGTCREGVGREKGLRPRHWRFRVPEGEAVVFGDGRMGQQSAVGGVDFGDFIVWRQDGLPSYQLAVTVDDAAMGITEVVRGADLLKSTARQLLLYRALGLNPPVFYHCPLVTDEAGVRLAKRHDGLSLRELRGAGVGPEAIRAACEDPEAMGRLLAGRSGQRPPKLT
jgi:glutamyl/glutaminyl-tRNA synthetase